MKKLYTHENHLFVHNAKHFVEEAGICCIVKNAYLAGGAGDLSPFDTWPELWVVNEDDYAAGLALLKKVFEAQQDATDWVCKQCGETNGSAFELCWKCGADL
ncbi:MAG: DUF2007 domain-containing protein [Candidatus Polarisedimenticolaceae bacterium]|nr:DUF2007 domain-containing protein [Candidatus Polarisedimenticolaceae bacterium]